MKSEKVKSKNPERCCIRNFLEAPPRLELGVKALQARALPLGYGAVKKEIALTLERETGFGPATSTLARWHSTTESLPHIMLINKHSTVLSPFFEVFLTSVSRRVHLPS